MILTCPQCMSRFLLPAHALGEAGKKVKCSSCGAIWFQDPSDTAQDIQEVLAKEDVREEQKVDFDDFLNAADSESSGDEADAGAVDDVPRGVLPNPNEEIPELDFESDPEVEEARGFFSFLFSRDDATVKQRAGGYGAAAVVFIFVLAGFIAVQEPLVKFAPITVWFYRALGVEVELAGSALIFETLEAETAADTVKIKGQIMNLRQEDQMIPKIRAILQAEDKTILEEWLIEIPEETVPGSGVLPFSAEYITENASKAEEVTVKFTFQN